MGAYLSAWTDREVGVYRVVAECGRCGYLAEQWTRLDELELAGGAPAYMESACLAELVRHTCPGGNEPKCHIEEAG